MFHTTAFLSPLLGFFYRDSGAGSKRVTPAVKFSGKNIRTAGKQIFVAIAAGKKYNVGVSIVC